MVARGWGWVHRWAASVHTLSTRRGPQTDSKGHSGVGAVSRLPTGAIPTQIEANGYKAYKYTNKEALARWIEEAAKLAGN